MLRKATFWSPRFAFLLKKSRSLSSDLIGDYIAATRLIIRCFFSSHSASLILTCKHADGGFRFSFTLSCCRAFFASVANPAIPFPFISATSWGFYKCGTLPRGVSPQRIFPQRKGVKHTWFCCTSRLGLLLFLQGLNVLCYSVIPSVSSQWVMRSCPHNSLIPICRHGWTGRLHVRNELWTL